jgi:ATP-dependent DNA ligase
LGIAVIVGLFIPRDLVFYHVFQVDQQKVRDNDHLTSELLKVEKLGGEGLMLRQPGSKYGIQR